MNMPLILIIDDEPGMIHIFSLALQRANYQISSASRGASGLQQAYSAPPDLILLDMMLPDMKGADLIRQLRQDAAFQHTPIIAMTAYPALLGEARRNGANEALCKPIRPSDLTRIIDGLL